MQTIYLGADHAGVELKNEIKKMLLRKRVPVVDVGTHSEGSVDYPDFAVRVAKAIGRKPTQRIGILVCGSGQGMAMTANKVKGVRAAVCYAPEVAQLAREHNNANVLCMGARMMTGEQARAVVGTFLKTPFAGGRHLRRVRKISELEKGIRKKGKRAVRARARVFRK